jgi:hypothetical protein
MTATEDYNPMKRPSGGRERVAGWGADLDPANRPAVPKEKPSTVMNVRGVVGERQIPDVRIHKSIEQPDLTPVFGTTCPPRGVSGKLRDVAYKFSEGRLAHWMTLILADRVDMMEGFIEDMSHGRAPTVVNDRAQHGLPFVADSFKRRQRTMVLAGVGVALIAVAVALPHVKKRRRR